MTAVTVTAASVRPTKGVHGNTEVCKGTLGGTVTAGQAVYLDGTNGWKPADADAAASAHGKGVALNGGSSGDTISIALRGPVAGFSSLTPGTAYYVHTTAGAIGPYGDLAAGDYPTYIGWALTATVMIVDPAPVGAVLE